MTDHDLLERYVQSRDEPAFAELARRHGAMVHAVAMRIARPDADDVSQAVFLLLAQRARKLSHLNDLGGWLYHTARLTALNANRQRARQKKHIEHFGQTAMKQDSLKQDSPTHSTETRELIDAALMRLSDSHRQVLILRYIESLSLEESASRLGLTTEAVAKRAERGLAKLRDYFRRRGLEYAPDSVASLLQLPTLHMNESQIAALAKAGQGGVSKLASSLAATTTRTTIAIGAKIAVPLIIAAAATGILVAATDHGKSTTQSATAPNAPPPAPVVVALPTTQPALTADGADQFASLFLAALRDRDASHLAGLLEGNSDAQKIALAQSYIAQFRDGPYANSPDRLTQRGGGLTLLNTDGRLTSVVVQCQPPGVAALQSVRVKLVIGHGRWIVDSVKDDLIADLESATRKTVATLPSGSAIDTTSSAAFAPPMQVICGWDGSKVTLPPALIVPPWLMQTEAFKQWLNVLDLRTFQIAGVDGFTYEVFVMGGIHDTNGQKRPLFNEVRQYRKDGALAAVSQYLMQKPDPDAWVVVDPTGTRLTFHAQRNVNSMFIQFFEPDGHYRQWTVNQNGLAVQETLYDPQGVFVRTVHSAWPKPKPATAPPATAPSATAPATAPHRQPPG